MPGIHLYTGNRLEILADKFAEITSQNPLSPLEQEIILVQSKGMARWLAMQTASRLNIWANCYCPFPNSFINKIFRLILPNIPDNFPYNKESIAFHLMDIIPNLLNIQTFKPVRDYLQGNSALGLFQLATEIADLFDQYTLYRPDMVLAWESGNEKTVSGQDWQPHLWNQLIDRLKKDQQLPIAHRARLFDDFQRTISDSGFDPNPLPSRISAFGISSLPPYHLNVLASMAQFVDLHFYIINPCREFWSDIIVDRHIVKISRQERLPEESLHLQEGNSLLASMGQLGRDLFAMFQNLDCQEHDFFIDPDQQKLLTNIQHDILNLHNRQPDINCIGNIEQKTESTGKQTIDYHDTSVVFMSCHSPMREIEVLHDHLLKVFNTAAADQPINPRDILVMTPDIDAYGPLIQAVFGAATRSTPWIPYTISDRTIRHTSQFIETFFNLLTMPHSRLTNVQVLNLLESEPVLRKFSINENDLAIIKEWIDKTGICWGINEDHKKDFGLPGFSANTWRAGLDRLLLGYAMPGNNQHIFKNVLPYDNMEGTNTQLLGNFLNFAEELFLQVHLLEQQHSMQKWSEILINCLEIFFATDDNSEPDRLIIHQILLQLGELQTLSSFDRPVGIDIINSYLGKVIEQHGSNLTGSVNFLSGGVTFCELLPMRAIPFKVICLLGMDDGSYPRPGQTKSFDLMFHEPRRGDRSRKQDDRYLFLEAILSARQQLYISYVGQSIKDDSPSPPSVLVSELMDYIDQGFSIEQLSGHIEKKSLRDHLTTRHRLQPFHPDYFKHLEPNKKNKLFSFSRDNYEAASVLAIGEKQPDSPLVSQQLPSPPEEFRQIDIEMLCSFYANPARFFLTMRLNIAPVEQLQQISSNEPFMIEGLARYILENDLLIQKLNGRNLNEYLQIKKAAGEIPHGKIGEALYDDIVSEVENFSNSLKLLQSSSMLSAIPIDITVNGFQVKGTLDNIYEHGLVRYRCANIQPKDLIQAWIYHLAINTAAIHKKHEAPATTFLAGKDKVYKFLPLADSQNILQEVLDYYWQGLTEPLHFFPQSSFAFAEQRTKGKSISQALGKAKAVWEGNDFRKGERKDPYFNICFKDTSPFNQSFIDQAEKIVIPLLEQQEKYKP